MAPRIRRWPSRPRAIHWEGLNADQRSSPQMADVSGLVGRLQGCRIVDLRARRLAPALLGGRPTLEGGFARKTKAMPAASKKRILIHWGQARACSSATLRKETSMSAVLQRGTAILAVIAASLVFATAGLAQMPPSPWKKGAPFPESDEELYGVTVGGAMAMLDPKLEVHTASHDVLELPGAKSEAGKREARASDQRERKRSCLRHSSRVHFHADAQPVLRPAQQARGCPAEKPSALLCGCPPGVREDCRVRPKIFNLSGKGIADDPPGGDSAPSPNPLPDRDGRAALRVPQAQPSRPLDGCDHLPAGWYTLNRTGGRIVP